MNRHRTAAMALLLGVAGALACTRVQAQAAADPQPAQAPQPVQPPQPPQDKTNLEPVAPVPATQAQVPAPPANETLSAAGSPTGPVGTPLTLEQAIERALTANEQPRIAAARATAAEARVDKARSFFFPDVTAQGSYLFRPDPVEDEAAQLHGLTCQVIAGPEMHALQRLDRPQHGPAGAARVPALQPGRQRARRGQAPGR